MNVLTMSQVLQRLHDNGVRITMHGLVYYVNRVHRLLPVNRPSSMLLFAENDVNEFVQQMRETPRRGPRSKRA